MSCPGNRHDGFRRLTRRRDPDLDRGGCAADHLGDALYPGGDREPICRGRLIVTDHVEEDHLGLRGTGKTCDRESRSAHVTRPVDREKNLPELVSFHLDFSVAAV